MNKNEVTREEADRRAVLPSVIAGILMAMVIFGNSWSISEWSGPVTKEEYNQLKGYVVKTIEAGSTEVVTDNNVQITLDIDVKEQEMNIECSSSRCKVQTKIPLYNYHIKKNGESYDLNFTIDGKSITYTEENILISKWFTIVASIIIGIVSSFILYLVISKVIFIVLKLIDCFKNRKRK